jgi:hypothetical protein
MVIFFARNLAAKEELIPVKTINANHFKSGIGIVFSQLIDFRQSFQTWLTGSIPEIQYNATGFRNAMETLSPVSSPMDSAIENQYFPETGFISSSSGVSVSLECMV